MNSIPRIDMTLPVSFSGHLAQALRNGESLELKVGSVTHTFFVEQLEYSEGQTFCTVKLIPLVEKPNGL